MIQVPGNAVSLIVLILSGSQVTTWITNLSQLLLQGILLTELIVFTCCRRRPYEQLSEGDMARTAGSE